MMNQQIMKLQKMKVKKKQMIARKEIIMMKSKKIL